jgi:hypothetical protein
VTDGAASSGTAAGAAGGVWASRTIEAAAVVAASVMEVATVGVAALPVARLTFA